MSELKDNPADCAGELDEAGTAEIEAITEPSAAAIPAANLTLGQTLRAAREAAQLSIDDVAQSLKFSPRQIELLEADDLATLPGTTIVRGFTRSYARLLRLDADSLLQLLDRTAPSIPVEVRPPDNMGVAGEPKGLQQMSLLMAAVIVISLAALLLGLWHFLKPEAARPAPPAETSRSSHPGPVATAEAVPAALPSSASPATSPVGATPAESQPPAPASTVPALLFKFSGKSWLEVTDATKQVIHSGENPAGSEVRLTGQPPFDIVIGNAPKVSMSYGERVIDLVPYTRADVARLKVE